MEPYQDLTDITLDHLVAHKVRQALAHPFGVHQDALKLMSRCMAPIPMESLRNVPCILGAGIRGIFGRRGFAALKMFGISELPRTVRQIRKSSAAIANFRAQYFIVSSKPGADSVALRDAGRSLPKSNEVALNTKWTAALALNGISRHSSSM